MPVRDDVEPSLPAKGPIAVIPLSRHLLCPDCQECFQTIDSLRYHNAGGCKLRRFENLQIGNLMDGHNLSGYPSFSVPLSKHHPGVLLLWRVAIVCNLEIHRSNFVPVWSIACRSTGILNVSSTTRRSPPPSPHTRVF